MWEIHTTHEDMDINTMVTTYNTAMTAAASEILRPNVAGKYHGSLEMFSTSFMRDEAEGAKQ